MSVSKRAYDILRGYVNREWDRVRGLEREEAVRELEEENLAPRYPKFDTPTPPKLSEADAKLSALRILGVAEDAEFDLIRMRFEELNQRSDPTNFPEGSLERERSASLQKRLHWAYAQLTKDIDVSEKRFRSLEID